MGEGGGVLREGSDGEHSRSTHVPQSANCCSISPRGVQRSLIDYGHEGIVGPRGHEIQPLTSTLCFGFKQVAFSSLTVSCQCLTRQYGKCWIVRTLCWRRRLLLQLERRRRSRCLISMFTNWTVGMQGEGTQVIKMIVSKAQ